MLLFLTIVAMILVFIYFACLLFSIINKVAAGAGFRPFTLFFMCTMLYLFIVFLLYLI